MTTTITRSPLVWFLSLTLLATTAVPAGAANQVVTNCSNEAELRSDLTAMQASGGGVLTFDCGSATIVLSSVLPEISKPTTIDGDNKITISGNNSSRIFVVSFVGELILQDIVLTNGSSTGDGGAIINIGALTLQHVTIQNSRAELTGGAIAALGPVDIVDSVLAANEATNGGAMIASLPAATATITNSVLRDNEATGSAEGWGGAILVWDGAQMSIVGSELHQNTARQGGAIYNKFANATVSITNSRIYDNATSLSGGAVYIQGGAISVSNVRFSRNGSSLGGGALAYLNGQSAAISGSTFDENGALTGGALAVSNSTGVAITNSTFSGNFAGVTGGAISHSNSTGTYTNVTITASNSAAGSGIAHTASQPERFATFKNTIFAGNTGSPNCRDVSALNLNSADGNLSDDDSCATFFNELHDNNGADAKLGPLGFHGGLTPTHVPQPGSAAIDAAVGNDTPSFDQRGVSRPQGVAKDVGAVEVASCGSAVALCGDANSNSEVSASDALRALQTAVASASCPLWLCDYNGSGSVSASDALAILGAAVGQPTTPACPPAWDCVVD